MRVNRPNEPAYAGGGTFQKLPLVLDEAELVGADVAILGAPMDDLVTNRPGARFGPREIRAAVDTGGDPAAWHMDLGIDPFAELRIVDHGDAAVIPADPHGSHRAIRDGVGRIARAGAIPVVLGGDHSITFPNVQAVAAARPEGSLALVHFDTHADTAAEIWGVKWTHGSPFRHLVDDDVISGHRLVQIGLRGYWPFPEEFEWARGAGVRWHRMEEIHERGIDSVMEDVLGEIEGADRVFLSIDIDVLDPAYAPGTGTPEPGGMTTRELLRAVRAVALGFDVAGIDVVEVSPPYDHAGITTLAAHRVVLEVLSAIVVRRRGGNPAPENP